MKTIALGGRYGRQGFVALVDDDKFDEIDTHHWCVSRSSSGKLYAVRSTFVKGRPHYMHHHVLPLQKGFDVDHIDGDSLNNQRANLRYATHAENLMNARLATHGDTGFRGVRRRGSGFLAIVQARSLGAPIVVGTFDTAEEAAAAYDAKVTELFGEFAWTNVKSGELSPAIKPGGRRPRAHTFRMAGNGGWATSGYKGVYPAPTSKRTGLPRWQAKIQVGRKGRHIGMFDSPEAAARAYNEAAFEAWGERAFLNDV